MLILRTTSAISKNHIAIGGCSYSAESDLISTSGTSSNKSGLPNVSTNKKKWNNKENYESICDDFAAALDSNKTFKCCCPKNFSDALIQEKKEEYNISNRISKKTIHACVYQENYNPKHCGTCSTLAQAEEELLAICIQIGKIWQPLLVMEGIEQMNALISGTNLQNDVARFQIGWKLCCQQNGQVGTGWWLFFSGGMDLGLLPNEERSLLLINLTG